MEDERIPERRFRRLFPDQPESFFKRNSHLIENSRKPDQPEQVDRKEDGKDQGEKKMGKKHRLCRVEITFGANHGRKLDEDNRRFIAKPILDALVELGFASDDKEITSDTYQKRMDNPEIDL